MSENKSGDLVKYDFIDALRGIAVLGVVMVHTHQNFHTDFGESFISLGQYGVMLFYIVSAFSLMLSLSKRTKIEKHPLLNYFIRRFFRIAPLFYVAVICYLLRSYFFPLDTLPIDLSHSKFTITPIDTLLTIGFLNGWYYKTINLIVPGGWSIAVETNFYMLLPFLFMYIRSIKNAIWLIVGSVIAAKALTKVLYILVSNSFDRSDLIHLDIYAGMWLPSQLPVFAAGIFMFHLFKNEKKSQLVRDITKPYFLLFVMLICIAILNLVSEVVMSKYVRVEYFYLLCAVIFSLYLAGRPVKVFVNKFFITIGTMSYGIYLFHFIVIQLLIFLNGYWLKKNIDISFYVAFPSVVIISFWVAEYLHRHVEVIGQEFGGKFIKSLETNK